MPLAVMTTFEGELPPPAVSMASTTRRPFSTRPNTTHQARAAARQRDVVRLPERDAEAARAQTTRAVPAVAVAIAVAAAGGQAVINNPVSNGGDDDSSSSDSDEDK